jgi:hypothetical protein
MNLHIPWMSRSDRRAWQSARTLADLGHLMADWLEGGIASWPGYAPNWGPDDETTDLVPTLAALCRTGFVTTGSQPGDTGPGVDGRMYEQRSVVDGLVTDRDLYGRIVAAAHTAGLLVTAHDPHVGTHGDPTAATRADGVTVTEFGHRLNRRDLRTIWPARLIGEDAFTAIEGAVQLTVAAPEYGAAGQRLWDVMDAVTGRTVVAPGRYSGGAS